MTDRESRVRTAVMLRALRGLGVGPGPADRAALAETAGLRVDDVASALAALHEAGSVYVRDDAVVAAYPFSFVPTPHRVTIAGAMMYANCAIDALAVPPMVDAEASIASACGECGAPIRLVMRASAVLRAEPPAAVVFYVDRDCCAAGPTVLTQCPHIQFFCGAGHAERWRRAHPELRGTVYGLADAASYAAQRFAPTIAGVREAR